MRSGQPTASWNLARKKLVCLASSKHGKSRCVSVCTSLDFFFFTFFFLQLCLGLLRWDLPVLSMVSGSSDTTEMRNAHEPTEVRRPISTLLSDICPQALNSPTPKQKSTSTAEQLQLCAPGPYTLCSVHGKNKNKNQKKQFQQHKFCTFTDAVVDSLYLVHCLKYD